jgi:branched-chain amino acid transport system permease protein
VSVAVLIVVMLVVHNIVRSRYGLAMIATRDNEIAAAASGINLAVVKTVAFGVSGGLTGLGGSLFAMFLGSLVADDSFTLLSAIALLTGLVIGGQATRFGPIVGAVAVVYIPYYTSDIGQGQASAVLFGAALIALIFVAPEGLTGGFFRLLSKLFRVIPRAPTAVRPQRVAPHPTTADPNPAAEMRSVTIRAEPIGGDLT